MRALLASSTIVVTGSTFAIADMARQNDCGDRATWLGYTGWTLVIVGALATAIALAQRLRARHWLAVVPAGVALLALLAAIAYAVIQTSLNSMCGFEIQL